MKQTRSTTITSKQFDDLFLQTVRETLSPVLPKDELVTVLHDADTKRQELFARVPFLKGLDQLDDPLSRNLTGAVTLIALYVVLRDQGGISMNTSEIGDLMYDCCRRFFESPAILESYQKKGIFKFEPSYVEKMTQRAEESKPAGCAGFVFEVVTPGEDDDWDYGVNYTQCGILEVARAAGALEVMPWMCLADYPIYRAFGIGLRRTGTLAQGKPFCDFRFCRDRQVILEIPEPKK